ncbi:MAG: hypothetical protein ACYDBZ_12440 [Steroidobacteraceae bacterium]
MAAIVRHWSTVLNGMQVDPATFRRETDAVLAHAAKTTKTKAKPLSATEVTPGATGTGLPIP